MSDLISRLSELRSQYNCFNESERDAYHTLSEAIEALQEQATLDDVSNAYENGYKQGKFEALQWIPVSERLPKVGAEILATITDDSYKNPVIIRHYEPELEEKILVAWMPLPEPYTEEEQ